MKKFIACAAATMVAATLVVPAFALDVDVNTTMSVGAKKTVDIACVQKAVDKREDALGAGWTAFNTSVSSAYAARKTALHDAWSKTDAAQRRSAVKAAWDAFKKSAQSARKTWKEARKNAWKTFRSEAKACKGTTTEVSTEAAAEVNDQ